MSYTHTPFKIFFFSAKITFTKTNNKSTKAAKKNVQDVQTVITSYKPSGQAVVNIRDIIVYDIPSS
jgi:hypothetical protein